MLGVQTPVGFFSTHFLRKQLVPPPPKKNLVFSHHGDADHISQEVTASWSTRKAEPMTDISY